MHKSIATLFPILLTLIYVYFIVNNNVYAINFVNFTSKNLGLQFEYPSEWKIEEKISKLGSKPDISISDDNSSANILFISTRLNSGGDSNFNTMEFTNQMHKFITSDYNSFFKTIESPSVIIVDEEEVGTFLITKEEVSESYSVKKAQQLWIVPSYGIMIQFNSPPSLFDNPENIEIRDHFIKSINFPEKVTNEKKSRFD